MMIKQLGTLLAVAALALASPLRAQSFTRQSTDVPPEHRPPAGMCRIWLDSVPPARQPAPTDCATAIRRRPPNGRVIFGSEPGRTPSTQGQPCTTPACRSDSGQGKPPRDRRLHPPGVIVPTRDSLP